MAVLLPMWGEDGVLASEVEVGENALAGALRLAAKKCLAIDSTIAGGIVDGYTAEIVNRGGVDYLKVTLSINIPDVPDVPGLDFFARYVGDGRANEGRTKWQTPRKRRTRR